MSCWDELGLVFCDHNIMEQINIQPTTGSIWEKKASWDVMCGVSTMMNWNFGTLVGCDEIISTIYSFLDAGGLWVVACRIKCISWYRGPLWTNINQIIHSRLHAWMECIFFIRTNRVIYYILGKVVCIRMEHQPPAGLLDGI